MSMRNTTWQWNNQIFYVSDFLEKKQRKYFKAPTFFQIFKLTQKYSNSQEVTAVTYRKHYIRWFVCILCCLFCVVFCIAVENRLQFLLPLCGKEKQHCLFYCSQQNWKIVSKQSAGNSRRRFTFCLLLRIVSHRVTFKSVFYSCLCSSGWCGSHNARLLSPALFLLQLAVFYQSIMFSLSILLVESLLCLIGKLCQALDSRCWSPLCWNCASI